MHGLRLVRVVTGACLQAVPGGLCLRPARLRARRAAQPLRLPRRARSSAWSTSATGPSPCSAALELSASAFQHALQSGDFQIACYCCHHIVSEPPRHGAQPGGGLPGVRRAPGVRAQGRLSWTSQDILLTSSAYVQQLRGLSLSFGTLSGDGFDEEAFEAAADAAAHEHHAVLGTGSPRCSRASCAAPTRRRVEAADKAAELLWSIAGHHPRCWTSTSSAR